jgi:predicted CXXCH cytochrome family protein
VLAGIIMAVIFGLLGCDPKTEYRVLSFFFDGVPLLPGMKGYGLKPVIGPGGIELDLDDPRAQEFLARDRARQARAENKAKDVVSFVHKPYAKRRCMGCHNRDKSFSAVTAETCQSCHKEYYDTQWNDWVHGPVALGTCSMCHVPHTSKYKGLLKKPSRDVCLSCHNEAKVLAGPHHIEAAFKSCVTCHDPHFAGNRRLLADAFSYSRRTGDTPQRADGHAKWDKTTCAKCHSAEKSKALNPGAEKVCVTCHEKVQHPIAGSKIHDPILKGKCLTCHAVHLSPLPHLIKPEAEGNCIECHKIEKLSTPRHSRFYRVDCLLCHAGHSSPKKHLLRVPESPPHPTTLPATMPAASTMPAATTEKRP